MTTARQRIIILALALLAAVVVAGMAVFLPRSNAITVRAETIRDEEGHYHRRWTFTGGRWESFGQGFPTGEHLVVLDRPGVHDGGATQAIKGTLGLGASRLIYDVEARRVPDNEANGHRLVSVRRTLSGNSMGGSLGFNVIHINPEGDEPWARRFRTTQSEDSVVTFPLRLKLGDFGGSAEIIEFR